MTIKLITLQKRCCDLYMHILYFFINYIHQYYNRISIKHIFSIEKHKNGTDPFKACSDTGGKEYRKQTLY